MYKKTTLYRFLYTIVLFAATFAMMNVAVSLYQNLGDQFRTKAYYNFVLAFPFPIAYLMYHFVELIILGILALSSLAFMIAFNLPILSKRMKHKTMRLNMKKSWKAWLAILLAAFALAALSITTDYYIGTFIQPSALYAALFFVMPFLWEYALGLNKE